MRRMEESNKRTCERDASAQASFDVIARARFSAAGTFDERRGARQHGFARRRTHEGDATARDTGRWLRSSLGALNRFDPGAFGWLAESVPGAHSGHRQVRSNQRSRGP